MIFETEYTGISHEKCLQVRQSFKLYVERFISDDSVYNNHMDLKRIHTAKVCKGIIDIGSSLLLNKEQLYFAEILAWLHDIGRFEQYHKYRTFADNESENHAVIGLRVIEQENILRNLSAEQKEIIYRCILNHNISAIPDNEPEIVDFYSRLLRDADKLDIWQINLKMNIMNTIRNEVQPDSYAVSQQFLNAFKNSNTIKFENVKVFFDSILFKVSWIFDLNFNRSFELVREREIVEKLLQKIPASKELEIIRDLSLNHLNIKCKSVSI